MASILPFLLGTISTTGLRLLRGLWSPRLSDLAQTVVQSAKTARRLGLAGPLRQVARKAIQKSGQLAVIRLRESPLPGLPAIKPLKAQGLFADVLVGVSRSCTLGMVCLLSSCVVCTSIFMTRRPVG